MRLLYIAGPFSGTTDMQEHHIRRAEVAASRVMRECPGVYPVVPHSLGRATVAYGTPEYHYAGTMALMERCDGVLLVGDWMRSKGAVAEEQRARALGMPVWELADSCMPEIAAWGAEAPVLTDAEEARRLGALNVKLGARLHRQNQRVTELEAGLRDTLRRYDAIMEECGTPPAIVQQRTADARALLALLSPAPGGEGEADLCAATCDHGSPCLRLAHDDGRHETQHGCVAYDPTPTPTVPKGGKEIARWRRSDAGGTVEIAVTIPTQKGGGE